MFRRLWAASVALMLLFALGPAPASAIADGQEDTTNIYANVAAIEYDVDGDWYKGCTATLIRPNVVLTAAHCVYGEAAANVRVNFNPVLTQPADPNDSLAYEVVAIVWHSEFAFGGHGVQGITALDSPFEDIALVWLAANVEGIIPAALPIEGYLDQLDLRAETFVAVGYGLDGVAGGSLRSGTMTVTRHAYRSYRDVSVLGEGPYPDRIVITSNANCRGDSGGPLFLGNTVVGLHDWTFDLRCEAPSGHYRVDSAMAQEFLNDNL